MTILAEGVLVWTGLALVGIGIAAAAIRHRLDRIGLAIFVAGLGVALVAAGLGDLAGSPAGARVARVALAVALLQCVVFLALVTAVARRLRATHTGQLHRLRG